MISHTGSEYNRPESDVLNGSFDPHDPGFIEDPYPTWAELRERCPVVHSDRYMGGFWTISRYEDVKAAVSDWRTFTSAVAGVTGIPMMIQRDEPLIPIEFDPPQHTRYRTLVSPLFRRDRVEELRPAIRAFADELLDPLLKQGRGDFATDYAKQLSLRTLGAFLGLPAEDAPRWAAWVETFHRSVEDQAQAVVATREFTKYLHELIADRRVSPGNDFVGLLTQATLDGHGLTDEEVRKFTIVVIAAGFETTAGGIGLMLHHLAHRPADYTLLREAPSLVPPAVEEFLRLYSPIQLFGRNAAHRVELHGQDIAAGEVVAVSFAAANRDPEAFTEPDHAVLDRHPNRHLAFGFGPHVCLGAHVARLELSVTLQAFIDRIATLSPDPVLPARRKQRGDQIGFTALPLVLETA